MTRRPVLVHLTTVDMSLALLLLPQLIAFRDAGYDVVGVSAPGRYVESLREQGIRHIPLRNSTRANDLRADLAAAREFVQICRRLQPDIVHTHNPKPGIYGRISARLAGVPVVVNTVHGLYAQPEDGLAKRAFVYGLERLASAFSDAELVQNPEDIPVMTSLGIPPGRLHLLGNGVDLSRFDPQSHPASRHQVRTELDIDDGDVLVGVVGRLVGEKGYRELFEAARSLRRDVPRARIVVVGPTEFDKSDGISQQEMELAASVGGIRFLGLRDDIERLYSAMDIYVLASHREGFPRSAMEASAMGLPVIATDIRGCRQVVEPDVTGLLVPARDATALAAAVRSLARDPGRRTAFGRAARQKALREFDDRRQVETSLELYERLQRHHDE